MGIITTELKDGAPKFFREFGTESQSRDLFHGDMGIVLKEIADPASPKIGTVTREN